MLSVEVAKILEALGTVTSRKRYSALVQLYKAQEQLTSQKDKEALFGIAQTLSLSYDKSKGGYKPSVSYQDGSHSASLDDIDDKAVAILKDAVDVDCPSWMRGQMAEIVWLKARDYTFAETAVTAYLETFKQEFDPRNWAACADAIERAYRLAMSLGKKSDMVKRVREEANRAIAELDGSDPLFLSMRLIELMSEKASGEELQQYYDIANKMFDRYLSSGVDSSYLLEGGRDVIVSLLKKLGKEDEVPLVQRKLATHYEKMAGTGMENIPASTYQAIHLLREACKLYDNKTDHAKVLAIKKRIEELQRVAASRMASVPFEIDATEDCNYIDTVFGGLSLREAIVQFGRATVLYRRENLKKQVLQSGFFIGRLFSQHLQDNNGHTIEKLPPLDLEDPEKNEDALKKHMALRLSEIVSIYGATILSHAFRKIQDKAPFSPDDFAFLVDNNALVPESRRQIVKRGLQMGFGGELYAAMHILLPQTEHIIRTLAEACGEVTTYINEDGCEVYSTLSWLLDSSELRECYDGDILFTLRVLLDDKAGANLRNMIAHGLLEPEDGESGAALYFLGLLTKILFPCSVEALDIGRDLAQKEMEEKPEGDE